jgi:hypothetical protein
MSDGEQRGSLERLCGMTPGCPNSGDLRVTLENKRVVMACLGCAVAFAKSRRLAGAPL